MVDLVLGDGGERVDGGGIDAEENVEENAVTRKMSGDMMGR